jgi:Reverse transcriptase (RNA-dependent DNA polymerase)
MLFFRESGPLARSPLIGVMESSSHYTKAKVAGPSVVPMAQVRTLLSVPGKVLSHVVLARLRPLMAKHQRPQQSGFTGGRSTMDVILALRMLSEVHTEFSRPLHGIYANLKAAFDSVDRDALWKTLKGVGIRGKSSGSCRISTVVHLLGFESVVSFPGVLHLFRGASGLRSCSDTVLQSY